MPKHVYVSRRVGKYRVGGWVPLKLLAFGFFIYLAFALFGGILVSNSIEDDKEFFAQRPVVTVAKWTCSENRDQMPEGLKRYSRLCWSTERNARGDLRYSAVEGTSIVKAK